MKTWKFLLAIIVTVAILGGGIYYWQNSPQEQENEPEEAVTEDSTEVMDGSNLTFDADSTECTERVTEGSELYGEREIWPLIGDYYQNHSTSSLGILFAAMACGRGSIDTAFETGVNESGIFATIYPSPSKEFKTALEDAGFVLDSRDEDSETWALTKKVDIDLLMPLREFANENWGSQWGGLDK